MKLFRLKIVIVIGLLAIVGVIIMQILLIKNALDLQKKETENKIVFALQDVLEKIYRDKNIQLQNNNQVVQKEQNYFIVNVNDEFEPTILEHYLKEDFKKVNLDLAFEYAVYNCSSNEMVYGNYIGVDGKKEPIKCKSCFKNNHEYTYYFAVRFPDINALLFKNIGQYWVFTAVLLLVLIIYVYSVLLLLKQKRYTELQKDFINNMTHEFKTPLSSILIASNFLKDQKEIKENPRFSKYNKIIIDQSNKLNQHVEQLLYVAKSDSKQMVIEKKWFELKPILELIKENINLKYDSNFNISIIQSQNFKIEADSFHFYNIVYNLVDNAVKYSKEIPKINIEAEIENQFLNLKITDNGIGIPEKEIPFVFDKFYRVTRLDSQEIEGFGIGLSYVKKICDLHHWKISIKNNIDNGITATIRIQKYE